MDALTNELNERLSIEKLFSLYFKYKDCSDLKQTEIGSYASYDYRMLSGGSIIIGEMKKRSFGIEKLKSNDIVIEYPKFNFLFDVIESSGYTCLYSNEFDDYIITYNLNTFFIRENKLDRDTFFVNQNLPVDNYSGRTKDKLIRYLQFHEAELIIDKATYQPITYRQLLDARIKNYEANT